jgi:hypothetical protein
LKYHYFDCDQNGLDSVQHLLELGDVDYYLVKSFEDADEKLMRLLPKLTRNDTVVIDTINSFMSTLIANCKFGTDPTESVWDKKDAFLNDKNYLAVYNFGTQAIMQRLKCVRNRGCPIITVAHQDEQRDPITNMKVMAPQANNFLYQELSKASSDVVRLYMLEGDEYDKNGELRYADETRFAQLRRIAGFEAYTKFHVVPAQVDKVPRRIVLRPGARNMLRLHKAYGKRPSWLTVYGPAGIGKTTFALSELEPIDTPTPKKEKVLTHA